MGGLMKMFWDVFVNYDNVISPEELSMELKGPRV